MKTASRILGSAAFHAGLVVQDSPVYEAERRGAPMAAFTRIFSEGVSFGVTSSADRLLALPMTNTFTTCGTCDIERRTFANQPQQGGNTIGKLDRNHGQYRRDETGARERRIRPALDHVSRRARLPGLDEMERGAGKGARLDYSAPARLRKNTKGR